MSPSNIGRLTIVRKAIDNLHDRQGSTRKSIVHYIASCCEKTPQEVKSRVFRNLQRAVDAGLITKKRGLYTNNYSKRSKQPNPKQQYQPRRGAGKQSSSRKRRRGDRRQRKVGRKVRRRPASIRTSTVRLRTRPVILPMADTDSENDDATTIVRNQAHEIRNKPKIHSRSTLLVGNKHAKEIIFDLAAELASLKQNKTQTKRAGRKARGGNEKKTGNKRKRRHPTSPGGLPTMSLRVGSPSPIDISVNIKVTDSTRKLAEQVQQQDQENKEKPTETNELEREAGNETRATNLIDTKESTLNDRAPAQSTTDDTKTVLYENKNYNDEEN